MSFNWIEAKGNIWRQFNFQNKSSGVIIGSVEKLNLLSASY